MAEAPFPDTPDFLSLHLSPQQRAVAWDAIKAPYITKARSCGKAIGERSPDPDAAARAAIVAEQAETKRRKTTARIDKLLASKAPKPDLTGNRWDAMRNRWVPA